MTETTKLLLHFWFLTDHRLPHGRKFEYHYFQREAVETIIYLYEVAGVRRNRSLVERYARRSDLRLLQYDEFARYGVKMATGQRQDESQGAGDGVAVLRRHRGRPRRLCETFLVIAPNVSVYERLRTDFEAGRIFRSDPVIPDELRIYWDVQCYRRGESERGGSVGALFLANIQQFYERSGRGGEEPDVMTAVMGPKPPTEKLAADNFAERISARGGPVAVIHDEAHHTHDEESEWNRIIRRLHEQIRHRSSRRESALTSGWI